MSPDFDVLRKEILDRFDDNIQAHLDKDADFIVDDIGEGFFTISEAEIAYPTKKEQQEMFTNYLNSTEFIEYRSLMTPEIDFSDDGSVAWGKFKVRVHGKQGDSEFKFDCAWLWIFRRVNDRWTRVGEVSTWK